MINIVAHAFLFTPKKIEHFFQDVKHIMSPLKFPVVHLFYLLGFAIEHASPCHMGVSENSVPLNPMVNDHYPY